MTIAAITRSYIYLAPLIPSILVAIFNLYHLIIDRALRKGVNNHVIVLLLLLGLIEEVTDVSWHIHYYRTGSVLSRTPAFCLAWVYISSVGFGSISILMAWASIERHIIVFYPHWFRIKAKRIYFHYVPLIICIVWPTVFYFIMFFILPCSTVYNYTRRLCNRYSCIISYPWISLFDSVAHYILPAYVTVIFSITLLIRALYHRYKIRGRIDWHNYKKMLIQLLSISALYILLQLPPMTMYAAYSAGLPWSVAASYYSDALFFNYWVILFTPFASIVSLPKLKIKVRKLFLFWRPANAVQPVMRRNANQTIAAKPVTGKSVAPKPLTGKSVAPKPLTGKSVAPKPLTGKSVAPQPVEVQAFEAQQMQVQTTVEIVPITVKPMPEPPMDVESVEGASVTEPPLTATPVRIIPVQVINITPLTPVEI